MELLHHEFEPEQEALSIKICSCLSCLKFFGGKFKNKFLGKSSVGGEKVQNYPLKQKLFKLNISGLEVINLSTHFSGNGSFTLVNVTR